MQGQPFGSSSKVGFVSFKLQNVCFIQRPLSYFDRDSGVSSIC